MFTKAVINRFIPFVFKGVLTSSFEKVLNPKAIMKENRGVYRDIIATTNYYRQNPLTTIKRTIDTNVIKFPKYLMRYDRSFQVIAKYIAEYSESQEEFDLLTKELFSCYKDYDKLIVKERVGGIIK